VPLICVGVAGASVKALASARRGRAQMLAAAAVCLMLAAFFAEGSVARVNGMRVAGEATDYEAVSRALHGYVPRGARVVGSTSLWWALRDTEYRSYFMFFYLTHPNAGDYRTTISGFLEDFDAEYLVVTRLAAGELANHLVAKDLADYHAFVDQHATFVISLQGDLVRNSYTFIDVWRFDR
jgi:hypothetical protein